MRPRSIHVALIVTLVFEIAIVISLRWLGWYGTGNAIQFAACLVFTGLPVVIAVGVLLQRGLRFSMRSLLFATTLTAVFLVLSMLPLARHRAARLTALRLLAAHATLNEGLHWDSYYAELELPPPPVINPPPPESVPPWLKSFTSATAVMPSDNAIRSIWINSDSQCQIVAENWERLTALQSVSVTRGVSPDGLRRLQAVLPQMKHLESVHTNDVAVPPGWYKSLTNVRTLWIWGEVKLRGAPFDKGHLQEIVLLESLEVLNVLGYALDDNDTRQLASSTSLKRVILRGTTVTKDGESALVRGDRRVYRN